MGDFSRGSNKGVKKVKRIKGIMLSDRRNSGVDGVDETGRSYREARAV